MQTLEGHSGRILPVALSSDRAPLASQTQQSTALTSLVQSISSVMYTSIQLIQIRSIVGPVRG